jgi:hypothetical protein
MNMLPSQPFQLFHLSERIREAGKKRSFSSHVDDVLLKNDSSSLQAELFSLKLIHHVISTVLQSRDSSDVTKIKKSSSFYEKVQDVWTKKFYEISGISSSSSFSKDSVSPSSYIDPRISFVFPPLKRIPGLEGFPPSKLFPKSHYLSKKEGPKLLISQTFKLKEQKSEHSEESKECEEVLEEGHQEKPEVSHFSSLVSDDVIHGSLVSVDLPSYCQAKDLPLFEINTSSVLGRVIQISRKRVGQRLKNKVKIRFPAGYDIEVPWPNSYSTVINEPNHSESNMDQKDQYIGVVEFAQSSDAASENMVPANDDDLLTEVNQFLDGFSLGENDDVDDEDGFLFNYTSVLDTRIERERERETLNVFEKDINDKKEETNLLTQSSSSLQPLETEEEKDYCVLLTGEKLKPSHLEEVEHYFDDVKSKKRKISWKLITSNSSALFSSSSFSSASGVTVVSPLTEDQKLHPEDDPDIVPSNPSILLIGQSQKV